MDLYLGHWLVGLQYLICFCRAVPLTDDNPAYLDPGPEPRYPFRSQPPQPTARRQLPFTLHRTFSAPLERSTPSLCARTCYENGPESSQTALGSNRLHLVAYMPNFRYDTFVQAVGVCTDNMLSRRWIYNQKMKGSDVAQQCSLRSEAPEHWIAFQCVLGLAGSTNGIPHKDGHPPKQYPRARSSALAIASGSSSVGAESVVSSTAIERGRVEELLGGGG